MKAFPLRIQAYIVRANALCLLKLLPRESADAARLQRAYTMLSVAADCYTPDRGGRSAALFDPAYPGTLYYASGVDFPVDRLPLAPGPLVRHAIGVLDATLTMTERRRYARRELSDVVRREMANVIAVCREVADAAGIPHADYVASHNCCK